MYRKSRGDIKPLQGHFVSLSKMIHLILYYTKIYMDLNFVPTSAMTLEPHSEQLIKNDKVTYNGKFTPWYSNCIRLMRVNITQWRQHTMNCLFTLAYLKKSSLYVDKVLQL